MVFGIFLAEALVAFCMLAFEVTAARLLAPFAGMSTDTWVAIIAAFLLALAAGNHIGGMLSQRRSVSQLLHGSAGAMAAGGAATIAVPSLLPLWDAVILQHAPSEIWRTVLFCALPCVPAGFLFGVVTPMLMVTALQFSGGRGAVIGGVYAAGAIGSAFGVLTALWLMLDSLGVRTTSLAIGLLAIANAILIFFLGCYGQRRLEAA